MNANNDLEKIQKKSEVLMSEFLLSFGCTFHRYIKI